jgi:two-component system nitrate/nitrite response regulator NarL
MSKLKIFLVDDHQIMIDGIKALLQNENEFEIIGESTQAKNALEQLAKTEVDIVITDIQMPGMSGLEFTLALKKMKPSVPVLVLSMSADESNIEDMIKAGVSGYVLKNTGRIELSQAILKIADGQVYFSEAISMQMMRMLKIGNQIKDKEVSLTPREIEIIKLIAQELSNAEIGNKLFISERTVETHRKNIFRKTQAKSVIGLVRYATQHKLL